VAWTRVGEIEVWVHDEGPSAGSPVVLVAGAAEGAHHWSRAWVEPLVAAGHRVVRYDQRGSGRSSGTLGADGLGELAGDLVGLLDVLGLATAHLVGRGLGGMVVQRVALDRPDRVRSLTLVSTTPGPDPRLSEPDAALVAELARLHLLAPPATPAEAVERAVRRRALFVGTRYPVDLEAERERARRDLALGATGESGSAHGIVATESLSRLDALAAVEAPTLVIHGDADPLFPLDHARALASRIAGARLVVVEGLGHELPDAAAPDLVPVILAHLAAADTL